MFNLSCASKFAHSRTILHHFQHVEGVWSSFSEMLRCVDVWEQKIEHRAQFHFLLLTVIILWASNILLPAIHISALQDSNSPSFSFTTRFCQYLEEHYQNRPEIFTSAVALGGSVLALRLLCEWCEVALPLLWCCSVANLCSEVALRPLCVHRKVLRG